MGTAIGTTQQTGKSVAQNGQDLLLDVKDRVSEAQETVKEKIRLAEETAMEYVKTGKEYVKEHPIQGFAAALAAGAVVGCAVGLIMSASRR